ncbi:MAG: hypothetical protein AB2A00_01145 [Myxococcota bacterium]
MLQRPQLQAFRRMLAHQEARLRGGDGQVADLASVRRAQVRLEQGSYGRCAGCGAALGWLQLAANPAAEHCADCATTRVARAAVTVASRHRKAS